MDGQALEPEWLREWWESDGRANSVATLTPLRLAAAERLHGLDIQRRIEATSDDAIQVEVGALYPALHRLEKEGLLISEWGVSASRRRAKFYELTGKGRKRLEKELELWERHAAGVRRVLGMAGEG